MPDSYALLQQLNTLLDAQFAHIIYCCNAPREYLPGQNAPIATQAIELLRYLEQQPQGLEKLQACLKRVQGGGGGVLPAEDFDISRLPRPSAELVGRVDKLQQLDAALSDSLIHLAVLEAGGGVGKSALSFAWLKAMQPDYHGYDKVFAWSFYSQGSHDTQTSSAEFFQAALPFLGYQQDVPQEDVEKGRALAKRLNGQTVLLILDGLEPLQHPPQVLAGELKDTGLRAFFDELYAQGAAGLVLVSSRQPIVELEEWDAAHYRRLPLETLPTADGVRLLTNLGVNGAAQDLQAACEDLGGHALALVLLGKLLKQRFNGRVERRDGLPPLWEEPKKGGHALRVLKFYETHLHAEAERTGLVLMSLLGLFDRPMGLLERDALLKNAEIAASLRDLDDLAWQRLEQQLEQAGLLLKPHQTTTQAPIDKDNSAPPQEAVKQRASPILRFFKDLLKLKKAEIAPSPALPRGGRESSSSHTLDMETGKSPAGHEPPQAAHAELEFGTPRSEWDTHPLIRAYFGSRFKDSQPELFRQAHRVLFEYYQAVPEQPQPDTLEALQPLYRAVLHGCLAGEFKKAGWDVYQERILRGDEAYSLHKLGAYSQDLTALHAFFPQGWTQPVQHGLSEANQAWLLAEASFCLMSLGRLAEAVEPRLADLKLSEKIEDWKGASVTAQNLVDLYLPLGRLAEAHDAAQQAIEYAEKAEDVAIQMVSHAYLGQCLHRQGQRQAALAAFERAEALQAQDNPNTPQLFSLRGFLYCAVLLDQAEEAAAVQQVLARGEYSLEIGKQNRHLLTISLDHLTLARAHWRLGQSPAAADAFQQAVTGIRQAGSMLDLPYFLIDRANFYLDLGRGDKASAREVIADSVLQAQADLQEAGLLIRRCGMKLYQVDWHLAMARLLEAQSQRDGTSVMPEAAKHRQQARDLIALTGYKLRLKEVELC